MYAGKYSPPEAYGMIFYLDFHTSPYIEGVGDHFDSGEFIKTLKDAHVNSINLFAKCHHGMYYYPTKIGTMHPNLKFDLFGEQIKACKENDIRALAYTCVSWNEDWADRHPEWLTVDQKNHLMLRFIHGGIYATITRIIRSCCVKSLRRYMIFTVLTGSGSTSFRVRNASVKPALRI